MMLEQSLTRRSFVKVAGATAALAGMSALAGCAGGGEQEKTDSADSGNEASGAKYDNTVSGEVEDLNVVLLGKDSKIAAIICALKSGYYEQEKLNINTQTVSGGFPEAMPALLNGTADVLPFGAIPTCTYVGQGDDLVIFGGTVANGSECVTLIENKDKYKTPEDFRGKRIGCFRMETGHMVTKSWLRENGIEDGKDVEFVLLESSAAEVAAVENGELDMCFVNSGYGYVATQGGKCAVAFRPNELVGREFPCCRQSTNRTAFEEKRSALIKFEIANLRALYDIENDHTGTIAKIVEYSGQPEEVHREHHVRQGRLRGGHEVRDGPLHRRREGPSTATWWTTAISRIRTRTSSMRISTPPSTKRRSMRSSSAVRTRPSTKIC